MNIDIRCNFIDLGRRCLLRVDLIYVRGVSTLAASTLEEAQSLHMEGELHLRVDAALNDEVAHLFERQRGLLAGLLIAGVECEPVGLNEGMMHGVLVAVDERDRVAPV